MHFVQPPPPLDVALLHMQRVSPHVTGWTTWFDCGLIALKGEELERLNIIQHLVKRTGLIIYS